MSEYAELATENLGKVNGTSDYREVGMYIQIAAVQALLDLADAVRGSFPPVRVVQSVPTAPVTNIFGDGA